MLASSNSPLKSTSQSGPCLYSLQLASSAGVMPLEGISTGFCFPGQCLQHSAGTNFLYSLTLFFTNGFHSLVIPLIQYNTTLESVKQQCCCSCTSTSSANEMLSISLATMLIKALIWV